MQPSLLLQQSINELELSEGFKEMAIQHNFRNLQDIVNWPANVLLLHHNFTYHIYQELREFLQKNELLYHLMTGKSQLA
ncbi:MAG: hypothetical protein ABIN01_08790 [Ferruginibacter sp.]